MGYPRRRKTTRLHRGVAATELAAALPVLVLIIFGSMQASRMIQLRHLGKIITDELVRDVVERDLSGEALAVKAEELATAATLNCVSVQIVENPIASSAKVELTIPVQHNYRGPTNFLSFGDVVVYTSAYVPR